MITSGVRSLLRPEGDDPTLYLKQRRKILAAVLLSLGLLNTACPLGVKTPSDVDKVENKINQAANGLNALAKTNRELYKKNVINLDNRKLVAGVINKANSGLDKVADRVFAINPNDPDSIGAGKIDVVKLLNEVSAELNNLSIGNEEIRLAAQAIIAILNEAIDLTNRVKEVRNAND